MENPFLSLPPSDQVDNPFLGLPMTVEKKSEPPSVSQLLNIQKQISSNIASGAKQGAYDLGDILNKAWLSVADMGSKVPNSLANMVGLNEKLPVNYNQYKDFVNTDNTAYDASPAGNSIEGKVARFGVNTAPYMMIPGGMQGALLKRMLTGGAAMAGIGAVNDIAEQNKFPTNTILGGVMGLATPPVIEAGKIALKPVMGAGKAVYNYLFPKGEILSKHAEIIGNDMQNVLNSKNAGSNIGFQLTPAEASGNPLLGEMQGNAGRTTYGSRKMYAFGKQHVAQQEKAIGNLISDISPNDASAADSVKTAAGNILSNRQKKLQALAQPYYDKAMKQRVNPSHLKGLIHEDPNIGLTIKDVLGDRNYAAELSGYSPNSIKVLDLAKRRFDAKIEQAKNFGDNDLVRVLTISKNKLIDRTDAISPVYKKARSIYSDDMPGIVAMQQGKIGKIANMTPQTVEGMSQNLFSPSRYNMNKFNSVRDQIYKQDPKAWNQITRNEMERRLDTGVGEVNGNKFYSKVIGKNRDFNQFLSAVKYVPGGQQKLIDMRLAFKNVINPLNSRSGAALAKTGMLGRRDSALSWKDWVSNITGGRHDKAMVDFITNPNWDKDLLNFVKSPKINIEEKAIKLGNVLGKIIMGNVHIDNNFQEGGYNASP